MCNFKIGDIVRSKYCMDDDTFYRIFDIEGGVLAKAHKVYLHSRDTDLNIPLTSFEKVTFYEMLDFIRKNELTLAVNVVTEKNWSMLRELTSGDALTEKRYGLCIETYHNSLVEDYANFYYHEGNMIEICVDFDNLDFEKDYVEYKIRKEADKFAEEFKKDYKDAFKKSMIYGEETTVGDFLSKCFNSYFDLINNDDKKVEVNMAKEKKLKDKLDTVDYWYDKVKEMLKLEPKEDEVFVNNKKKTTVIKWADGTMTKATCDKDDKYDLEKGVMVAMLKKYYTVDEINTFIEKAKESQEKDMHKWRKKEHKKVYPKTSKKVKQ